MGRSGHRLRTGNRQVEFKVTPRLEFPYVLMFFETSENHTLMLTHKHKHTNKNYCTPGYLLSHNTCIYTEPIMYNSCLFCPHHYYYHYYRFYLISHYPAHSNTNTISKYTHIHKPRLNHCTLNFL